MSPVSYWWHWGSIPHGPGPRASTARRFLRPQRALRCVFGASNHACPPVCSRADPVNGSYKHWQVRLWSTRRAPTAGARRGGRVGRLPPPLPLPAASVPAAAAAHAHHTHTRPGPGEPERCSDTHARSARRAAAGFRPGRGPGSPTVPPACRGRLAGPAVRPDTYLYTFTRSVSFFIVKCVHGCPNTTGTDSNGCRAVFYDV